MAQQDDGSWMSPADVLRLLRLQEELQRRRGQVPAADGRVAIALEGEYLYVSVGGRLVEVYRVA